MNQYHIQTLQINYVDGNIVWKRFTCTPLPNKETAEKHIDLMVASGCDRNHARLELYTAESQKRDLLDEYPTEARKLLEKLTAKMTVAKLKETLEMLRK